MRSVLLSIAGLLWWPLYATPVAAEVALRMAFDGPEKSWQVLDTGAPVRVLTQDIIRDSGRTDGNCERLAVATSAGQSALLACSTGRFPLIPEFGARLWVKCSRPGVQLAARVVFPRSRDPKTGLFATTIIRGPHTRDAGRWQQLALTEAIRLRDDQVRSLRATSGTAIDTGESYVDAIILTVPGDPQGTEIRTDALEVDGVQLPMLDAQPAAPADGPKLQAADAESSRLVGAARRTDSDRVRLQGTVLFVDGKPFALRAIEWNGEPIDFLVERGFNAVKLNKPPTVGQLFQAERFDLWFICPPPPAPLEGDHAAWDRVLAWFLEDEAANDSPAHYRNWAEEIRGRKDLSTRPIVISPRHEWAGLSEIADVIESHHRRDTRLPATEYAEWLSTCGRIVRPGTPLWASIGTQFSDEVRQQVVGLSGQQLNAVNVNGEQIESSANAAIVRGCRGVVFRSNTPLNATDPATRRRAAWLELLNRRSQLVGPWIAAGAVASETVAGDDSTTAAVLWVDQSRLLIPAHDARQSAIQGAAATIGGRPPGPIGFVVPGVPDSHQALLLTPAALRPLPTKRVAGGTRIMLDASQDSLVVITQDPQAIAGLRQRIARDGAATVRLERDVATLEATEIAETGRQLAAMGSDVRAADQDLASSAVLLRQVDTLLAAGQLEMAYPIARAARRRLAAAAIAQQRLAAATINSGDPLAVSADTFLLMMQTTRRLQSLPTGDNILFGGDCEDLDELTQFGWEHLYDSTSGDTSSAELTVDQPYHGRACLRLRLKRVASAPADVAGGAIRVLTPPISLPQGQLVEISGWARIAAAGSNRGPVLEIEDSFGGPELGHTLAATTGWQPFQIVRAATGDELRVGFSVVQGGTVDLDAVMVRPLNTPLARRLPDATSPTNTPLR